MKNLFGLIILFFFTSYAAYSQHTISGKVFDAESKDPLMFASVYVEKTGVTANEKGEYILKLQKGRYKLKASYIGYTDFETIINVKENMVIDILLNPSNMLDEIVVSSKQDNENVSSPNMGVQKMDMVEIKRIPALMGEVDLVKAIQLLPGVQPTSEGSAGFSVRGGSPDQNLILLDNSVVYNASHLMGFFSVFNNDVISNLKLYKGDLPLQHGGRLSSLLDIQTINKMPKKFTGTGGVGLISSRLVLQGPIGEKTSWLIGGRRSYADLFLKLSSDKDLRKTTLYFYDINAKLLHRFSDKDDLAINLYNGKDKFGSDIAGFNYSNSNGSVSWNHRYNSTLSSKVSFNVTNYTYGLETDFDGARMKWDSKILDLGLRIDFVQNINKLFKLSYGATSTYHKFNPGLVISQDFDDFYIPKNYALEHGVYLSNEQHFGDKVSLKYGVRWSIFQNMGEAEVYNLGKDYEPMDTTYYKSGKIYNTYHALEPRVSAAYKFNEKSSIKASFARNTQFLQLANNSASGSPFDIWFPASPNIKPQKANLYSAGYFRNFENNNYEASVEAYYKEMSNVIDFRDHAQLLLNKQLEKEVRTGTGKAYGVELMVKKNTGRLTGFINYTLSRSERTIPEINNGKAYLAPYDKTHVINVVLSYAINKKWEVSGNWVYSTGNPITYPTGRFEIDGQYFPIYSGRNEYRRPDYHRLDLSVNFVPKPESKKRWKGEWNLSLYNAYGRKNPWVISFVQDDGGIPYGEMTYLFSVVPSITYNFKF